MKMTIITFYKIFNLKIMLDGRMLCACPFPLWWAVSKTNAL